MPTIIVHLLKPSKNTTITYTGELLSASPEIIVIEARWDRPTIDLGYVVFATGDRFIERYYTTRWYNIFEVRSTSGQLKGWYCNVTRPAQFDGATLSSEDLELDLFVSPDRAQLLRLDLDEFAARDFEHREPATHTAALAALGELEALARAAAPPFDAR